MTKEFGEIEKIGDVKGSDLIGLECKAHFQFMIKYMYGPCLVYQ